MADVPTSPQLLTLSLLAAVICSLMWRRRAHLRLPPGPRGLPIVGYLPFIHHKTFHSQLAQLAQTYGPIMSLRLGAKIIVVVTSPAIAWDVLRAQDAVFSSRSPPTAAATLTYGTQDMVWSSNGPLWRLLRKLVVREVMTSSRLDAFTPGRRLQVCMMLQNLMEKAGSPVNLEEESFVTALNSMMSMMWGGSLKGKERQRVGSEFRHGVEEGMRLIAAANVSDYFPILARFDLQGVLRQTKKVWQWTDRFFDDVIKERMNKNKKGEEVAEDMLQVLLRFVEEEGNTNNFNLTHIKTLFLDLFFAGTDTTATTISWAMAELLLNPEILRKAQDEIDAVVSKDQLVEEHHLSQLRYIKAIIKESMRLHAVAPLLIPHSPSETCTLSGYTIPKNTQIFVNAWAIHRDPKLWSNPLEFQPERFLSGSSLELSSGFTNDLRYIPFGSGRRICAGAAMADRMIPHILASLLHAFDWKLPERETMDMSGQFGVVLKKAVPLLAIPIPRLSIQF